MTESATPTVAIYPLPEDRELRIDDDRLPRPEDARGPNALNTARLLAEYQQPGAALKILQSVVSSDPDRETYASAYLTAGQVREQLRQYETAAACYREAISREPENRDSSYLARNNLSYCLNRLGRYQEAEVFCRQAIEIDARRFNAHKNLGAALEGLGRIAEAADSYRNAARAEPHDFRALRLLRALVTEHPELASKGLTEELGISRAYGRSGAADPARLSDGAWVRQLLETVTVHDAISAEGLQVFGLSWDSGDALDYRTLDEALADGALEVTEISEQGSVPTLKVTNRSDARVFLMAGEELIGAKQNRVLNASLMVDSRVEIPLPVSCVEQGRWSRRSRGFRSSGSSSHSSLRLMMSKHTYHGYRVHGTPTTNQGEVWNEVGRLLDKLETHSATHALQDVYQKLEDRLNQVQERIRVGAHWYGAAFAFGGSIVGLDLFDRPATLGKLWPKLIKAYAIDTMGENGHADVSRERVDEWVRGFSRSLFEAFRSPGLGTDVRLEGRSMIGAMLVVEDRPVHLEAFMDEVM